MCACSWLCVCDCACAHLCACARACARAFVVARVLARSGRVILYVCVLARGILCARAARVCACVDAWNQRYPLKRNRTSPLLGAPQRHAPPSAGQVALLTHATPQFDEPRAIVRGAAAATLDGGARFVRKQYSYLGSGGEVR